MVPWLPLQHLPAGGQEPTPRCSTRLDMTDVSARDGAGGPSFFVPPVSSRGAHYYAGQSQHLIHTARSHSAAASATASMAVTLRDLSPDSCRLCQLAAAIQDAGHPMLPQAWAIYVSQWVQNSLFTLTEDELDVLDAVKHHPAVGTSLLWMESNTIFADYPQYFSQGNETAMGDTAAVGSSVEGRSSSPVNGGRLSMANAVGFSGMILFDCDAVFELKVPGFVYNSWMPIRVLVKGTMMLLLEPLSQAIQRESSTTQRTAKGDAVVDSRILFAVALRMCNVSRARSSSSNELTLRVVDSAGRGDAPPTAVPARDMRARDVHPIVRPAANVADLTLRSKRKETMEELTNALSRGRLECPHLAVRLLGPLMMQFLSLESQGSPLRHQDFFSPAARINGSRD